MTLSEIAAGVAIGGALLSGLAWLIRAVLKQRLEAAAVKYDLAITDAHHEAHEDLCARRYAWIEATHAQLVKVSDERHEENRERLQGLDAKLDRLLERQAVR